MSGDSLRERSKARRRAAIEEAAVTLFATRGYDATTIAEIAAAAEVAPRTVSLYFPSKLDLALASTSQAAARLTNALQQRPPTTTVIATLLTWLDDESTVVTAHDRRLRVQMFNRNPELRALRTTAQDEAARVGLAALTAELGDTDDGLAARIAVAAILGVLAEYDALIAHPREAETVHRVLADFLDGGLANLRPRPPGSCS